MPWDVVGFGETMLRLSPPNGGRLEDASGLDSFVAGAESNALACASRLGLRCAWLSALPDNPLGRRVVGELRRHGVDTRAVVWADEAARLGVFYAEESPAPAGPRVHYDRSGSAVALIDPDVVDVSVLDGARALHLTGITPALGPGPREVFSRLLRRAKESGAEVCFDVNYRAKLWDAPEAAEGIEEACRTATVLVCSRDDAAALWGLTGDAEDVVRRMACRFGSGKAIVLTQGGKGAAELRGGRYDAAPAFPSEGGVRFGAGDAFTAGYLYAYLGGEHYTRAREELAATPLLFANALAALKRCIAGDIATVTVGEALELVGANRDRFR